jgi:Skp family chaperone for outer membrane proteins
MLSLSAYKPRTHFVRTTRMAQKAASAQARDKKHSEWRALYTQAEEETQAEQARLQAEMQAKQAQLQAEHEEAMKELQAEMQAKQAQLQAEHEETTKEEERRKYRVLIEKVATSRGLDWIFKSVCALNMEERFAEVLKWMETPPTVPSAAKAWCARSR